MELVTRPLFYQDVAEEVEYLARKAGPDTATRWHAALEASIQELLRHPCMGYGMMDLPALELET